MESPARDYRQDIIRLLYPHHQISRVELARTLGIAKSTVSKLVNELLDEGIVIETAIQRSESRGKPAISLSLNHAARQMIVLDLSEASKVSENPHIAGYVCDLSGTMLQQVNYTVERQDSLNIAAVDAAIDQLIQSVDAPLLGIGVASPGIITDHQAVTAPNLGWQELALGEHIQTRYHVPAHINNNANVAALAEARLDDSSDNMMLVQISRGIGVGTVINGNVITGPANSAGEIAHLVVEPYGNLCQCGKLGCLETITSVPAVAQAIEQGTYEQAIRHAGEALGTLLATPLAVLGMNTSVIHSTSPYFGQYFTRVVEETINSRIDPRFTPHVSVRLSRFGKDICLHGEVLALIEALL